MAAASASSLDLRALRSLPTAVVDGLLTRGCRVAGQLLERPQLLEEVLAELRVASPQRRAQEMLAACHREVSDSWSGAKSALRLLEESQARPSIVLPSRSLGELLGGALRHAGSILELCGLPGSGKTQLCMQLCAAAQIPLPLASSAAAPVSLCSSSSSSSSSLLPLQEAVYIDAEGSFGPRRYSQICQHVLSARGRGGKALAEALEQVLRGLYVCRTYDATELFCAVKEMRRFLFHHPAVRLLVIDSLAFSFRTEAAGGGAAQRARVLQEIAASLRRYGAEYGLVAVVTNHMTTRFGVGEAGEEMAWLAPALGETWAHQPSTQLRLERRGTPQQQGGLVLGKATVTKSVEQAAGNSWLYRITEEGLCDCEGEVGRAIVAAGGMAGA